jgi:SAM-dependent methyltransferase
MASDIRQAWWYAGGIFFGFPNALRRRVFGYGHPRPNAGAAPKVDAVYAARVVSAFNGALRSGAEEASPFVGKRVLEFGPGPDLLTGVAALLLGARSYAALDRFPLLHAPVTVADVDRVAAVLPGIPEWRVADVRASVANGFGGALRYYEGRAEMARDVVPGEFDVVMSQAAFEHFENPGQVFRGIAALLAPGGATVHEIDFQTHNRFLRVRDPLNILRYSEALYRALIAFPGAPNRVRASEYVRLAREAGLTDVRMDALTTYPSEEAEQVRPYLSEPYRSATPADLTTLSARLLARKPI